MTSPLHRPGRSSLRSAALLSLLLAPLGCSSEETADTPTEDEAPAAPAAARSALTQLLQDGQAVFGRFAGEKSRAGGVEWMGVERADFQLYSMESGPWDVATMEEYIAGMVEAGGESAMADFPIIVRTPAIHTDPEMVAGQVEEAMATGIAGITFPHVTTADEAARSAELMGSPWPLDPTSSAVNILIVEDQEGISNVREIMQTPGLSVVFAGPGDLRRAYEGDMEAVESAIQAVLSACLEFDVACGVTAGVADIAERLDQGFRVIIVTQEEALAVGMAHAGRTDGM